MWLFDMLSALASTVSAQPTATTAATFNDIRPSPTAHLPALDIEGRDGLIINNAEASSTDDQPLSTITVWVTEYDSSTSSTPTATTTESLSSTSAVTVAETIGLIMPNPYDQLYTDLNYTFGFVDIIPRPAPTYGSWIRQIQPLLVFPDYTVNIFPSSGTDDPTSSEAVPVGSDSLCGATVENYAISYPYLFTDPGWYMFVINQTYMQANVTENNQCAYPIIQEKSFFATQTLSIAARPTWSPGPSSPVDPYTVYAAVSTSTPSTMPYDPQPVRSNEKLGIALGVAGGVLGLALIIGTMWWVRKKRLMDAEALAFSRLSAQDQEAFLLDNPESFLNPNRPSKNQRGRWDQGPPAPPGTMAYAIWYSQQLWNQQWMGRHQQPPSAWGNYMPNPQMVNSNMGRQMGGPVHQQWGGVDSYGRPVTNSRWR